MLNGTAVLIPNGTRGFDTNDCVSATSAALFVERGFRFALRYIRRDRQHSFDLSADELAVLFSAGLAVMAVQHVESESSWEPSAEKGTRQGSVAAEAAHVIGLGAGTVVWCDLEGVSNDTPESDVIAYCNNWYDAVASAGFLPGLYVGWHPGISASALYTELRYEHYWAAYNLNRDQRPRVRGVQMQQFVKKASDGVAGLDYQTDIAQADGKAGQAIAYAPAGWA